MKLKYSFLPIPEEIALDPDLSWGAIVLFGIMAKTNYEEIKWSKRKMAERMNVGLHEIASRIKELEKKEFITVNRNNFGKINTYKLNISLIVEIQKRPSDKQLPVSTLLEGVSNKTIEGQESTHMYIKEHIKEKEEGTASNEANLPFFSSSITNNKQEHKWSPESIVIWETNKKYIQSQDFSSSDYNFPDKNKYNWKYLLNHGNCSPDKFFTAIYWRFKEKISDGYYSYQFNTSEQAIENWKRESKNATLLAHVMSFEKFQIMMEKVDENAFDSGDRYEYKFEWKLSTILSSNIDIS